MFKLILLLIISYLNIENGHLADTVLEYRKIYKLSSRLRFYAFVVHTKEVGSFRPPTLFADLKRCVDFENLCNSLNSA